MDTFIIRYDNKSGFAGKLLGVITFTDGKSCKVWDQEVHKDCLRLEPLRAVPVKYTTRPSKKWGDSLTSIDLAVDQATAYDLLRQADELRGGGVKANSFLGHQISKGVQKRVDRD